MKVVSRSGDDLAYYSQLFQIPRVLIEDANPAITGEVLPNGMEVQIPGYIVQEESRLDIDFAEIALQYHLPIDGISLLNQDGKNLFRTRPGDESHDCHRQAL